MGSFLKVQGILARTLAGAARRLAASRNRVPTLTYGSPYGGPYTGPYGGPYSRSFVRSVRRGWTR